MRIYKNEISAHRELQTDRYGCSWEQMKDIFSIHVQLVHYEAQYFPHKDMGAHPACAGHGCSYLFLKVKIIILNYNNRVPKAHCETSVPLNVSIRLLRSISWLLPIIS